MTRTGRHKWPTSNRNGGRLQIGAVADFVSESVAGFGGIRSQPFPQSWISFRFQRKFLASPILFARKKT
jgi:hypothetical protein